MAQALAQALVAALVAGGLGAVAGLAAAFGLLPFPTGPTALLLTVAVIGLSGIWLEGRYGGGRGLLAALIALVPTWLIFPEVYMAGAQLPAPAALGFTAAVVALVPGFTFSYLRARRRPIAQPWAFAALRCAGGTAGIALLITCQLVAVAALDVPWGNPEAGGPALPDAVAAVVDRTKQSIVEVVDRVTHDDPAQPTD